jgi:hypothetical protein
MKTDGRRSNSFENGRVLLAASIHRRLIDFPEGMPENPLRHPRFDLNP